MLPELERDCEGDTRGEFFRLLELLFFTALDLSVVLLERGV